MSTAPEATNPPPGLPARDPDQGTRHRAMGHMEPEADGDVWRKPVWVIRGEFEEEERRRRRAMEPNVVCADPACRWNQPLEPWVLRLIGAPDGWAWPHRHEGDGMVLHLEIG